MVFQDRESGKLINKLFVTLKVVKNEGESDALKKQYHVPGYPTIIVLNNDGSEVDRIVGFSGDKAKFVSILEDYASGKNTLAQLIKQYQSDSLKVEYNYALGKKYTKRYEAEKAAKYFQNILALDPNNQSGYHEECKFRIAVYEVRANKNIQPLREFMQESRNEDFLVDGYFALIRHFKAAKDTTLLLAIFEEAVTKLPNKAQMMNAYAWEIYESKLKSNYQRGIELAKKAVELEPNAAPFWDTLAWLYYESGNIDQAIKAMQKAVELEPDSKSFKESLQKMQA